MKRRQREKRYKVNDIVTYNNERSSKVDGTVVLYKRRKDLEKKWQKLDGIVGVQCWEGILKERNSDKVLLLRNRYNYSNAEFSICPDYDGDLKRRSLVLLFLCIIENYV